jgi:hypothetical protein
MSKLHKVAKFVLAQYRRLIMASELTMHWIDNANKQVDSWVDGRMDGWTVRWLDGWMVGWLGRWTDGWIES